VDANRALMVIFGSAFFFSFVIAIVGIALSYMKQMERIKRQPSGSKEVVEAIEAIRKELADLRETSTRYDVSFDTALQRMEGRLVSLESRTNRLEQEVQPTVSMRT
jgi:hypothetical protein